MFAAGSADQILCLNALKGDHSAEDREVALKCFMGPRIHKIVQVNSKYIQDEVCKKRFLDVCSEIRKCASGNRNTEEDDTVFGGKHLFCGFLGEYLDFFWRIQGGLPQTFNDIDGANLCKSLVQ